LENIKKNETNLLPDPHTNIMRRRLGKKKDKLVLRGGGITGIMIFP